MEACDAKRRTRHRRTRGPGTLTAADKPSRAQLIKWVIYGLLLVNFAYYFVEEVYIASHTLGNDASLVEWLGAFATTIDEFAWFSLLFMFELETYQLSDETLERRSVRWSIHGARALSYVLLAHTLVQWEIAVLDFNKVALAEQISSPCQVADGDRSFGKNFRYTVIDGTNCETLSSDHRFYFLEPGVITDHGGYELEEKLLWVDLVDAGIWLIVVLLIELAVRLQGRGVTGRVQSLLAALTKLLYGGLFATAVFWLWAGHWVYAWDQFVWICGFWIIGRNLSEWRAEIEERGR